MNLSSVRRTPVNPLPSDTPEDYDPHMTAQPESADYDTALPGAQTELAPSASETEAHTAWALDDDPDWVPPFWTAGRITAVAVGMAVAAVIVTAGLAGYHLRPTPKPAVAAPPSATIAALPPAPVTVIPPLPTRTVTETVVPTPVQAVRPAVSTYWTSSMDSVLLADLETKGWRITNPSLIVAKARGACTAIDEEHLSVSQMIDRLMAETNGAANAYQAADDVVYAAMDAYEPCFRR